MDLNGGAMATTQTRDTARPAVTSRSAYTAGEGPVYG